VERRPQWEEQDRFELGPLSSIDLQSLLTERATGPIAADALLRIVDSSQGNPLFAEQLLASVDEDTADTAPASLRRLLTMRLDRPQELAHILGDHLEQADTHRRATPAIPSPPSLEDHG